jgi:hypothetical protein
MNIQMSSVANEKPVRSRAKRLAWALPLFFLIKGLLWLTVPVLYAIYGLD